MKIGIFAPFAQGDMIMSTSVLRSKRELWGECEIIWFAMRSFADSLAGIPEISEIRWHDGQGGTRAGVELTRENWLGHSAPGCAPDLLSLRGPTLGEFRKEHPLVQDLDRLYFPCLWAWDPAFRSGTDYGLFHRRAFGVPDSVPAGHPCLTFTPEEDEKAAEFVRSLSTFERPLNIMLETVALSGQSRWDDSMTIDVCRMAGGILQGRGVNFVFGSPGSDKWGFGKDLKDFTVRQCIPVYNACDYFIGVGSGISWATCSWSALDKPRIEYVHSPELSVKCVSGSSQHSVAHDRASFMALLENDLVALKNNTFP